MKYSKQNRRFLNTPKSGCLGAVAWDVAVAPHWNQEKYPNRLMLDANIQINDQAQSQYVTRKGDMLPVYRMRDELNKFIEACEKGIDDVRNS